MDLYTKVRIIGTCLTFLIAGAYLMTTALWPESPLGSPAARREHRRAMLLAFGSVIVGNLAIWTAPFLLDALVNA